MQPPKATYECNYKNPISNHVAPRIFKLYEPKITLDIFFVILWLCEGYYWVSLHIHFEKVFESNSCTLAPNSAFELKCMLYTPSNIDPMLEGDLSMIAHHLFQHTTKDLGLS